MLLKNAKIFDEKFNIVDADIRIEGEYIKEISSDIKDAEEVFNLNKCMVLPGFIDIHTHGCAGFDTCDASEEALMKISENMARNGVTSYCATSMTLSENKLAEIFSCVKKCSEKGLPGAYIQGINMEGPFINIEKKGAQNGEYVQKPDFDMLMRLHEISGNMIKLVDIAPECLDENSDFIEKANEYMSVSLAHTNASYEQAMKAFEAGASQVTHLYNAMTGLSHRNPGVVGACFNSKDAMAEIICDGIHIHPAALRIAFKLLGEDRSIIISDSLSATDCPNGEYELGEQKIIVKDSLATLEDGTIAGSTTNLLQELKNVISYGVPLKQAVKSVSINPAKQLRVDKITGSIKEGKLADIVVLDKDMNLLMVVVKGEIKVNNIK